MVFKGLGTSVSAVIVLLLALGAGSAQVPSAQHVVLVINENSSFRNVMTGMPWLVSQGMANGYATNYQSDNGGSLMDYLWLASGSCHSAANCTLPPGTHDFNCNGNSCDYPGTGITDPITDDNIFRELNNAGISWKVYVQSYSLAGGTPTTPDRNNNTSYYRRHNAAVWYSDILSNVDGSASNVVDLSQLAIDLANGVLPRYVIIVPDGNHDAHDCPVGLTTCTGAQKLAATDQFLSSNLDQILSLPDFQPGGDGLIFVTFDECAGGTNQGCGAAVYAAAIGPTVAPHTVSSAPYKHENMLRTILDALGVNIYPGAAATAADMSDFFASTGNKPEVVTSFPASGALLNSPVSLQASAYPTLGQTLSRWHVYVDGLSAYRTGAVDSIHPNLSMRTGKHSVLVRAWDTSGAFGDQTLSLTVSALKPTVTVLTPQNNGRVGTPVNVVASASPTAGHAIRGWRVYVDGRGVYATGASQTINTNVPVAAGNHTVLMRAWDTSGAFDDQTVSLMVGKKPAVAVSAPLTRSNAVSPIQLQASAIPSAGHTITRWSVYVDGVAAYKMGRAASINPSITAPAGAHTVLVRVWDSSGAFGDQTLVLGISQVAVNVRTPANGATVNSLNLQADAASTHAITGWHIYVDSVDSYAQANGNSINANLAMSPGAHSVRVRAWDSTGSFGDQTVSVVVP